MIFIGIDPGQSGGIAVLGANQSGIPLCYGLDTTEKDIRDVLWPLQPFMKGSENDSRSFALIERVHSMPKQGVASSFKFGQNYGFLRGCLISLGIPFEEVTPQKWQKAMGCLTKGDKNVSKAKCQQLFPSIKVTHAIADALLIAEFARRTHGNGQKEVS